MHSTGLSKETEEQLDKWDDPQYMSGFTAGCEATKRTEDDLRSINETLEERIRELNEDLGLCVSELHDLKQPWYVKLWNKLPRISINIERGA